jgi:hypothetical protein
MEVTTWIVFITLMAFALMTSALLVATSAPYQILTAFASTKIEKTLYTN